MTEFRLDPTTGEWVIIAPERAGRPHDSPAAADPGTAATAAGCSPVERDPACPFCPGNEALTPREILRWPEHDTWQVRVVPNKYPILGDDAGSPAEPAPLAGVDPVPAGTASTVATHLYAQRPGRGRHEVLIEGRWHAPATGGDPDREVTLLAALLRLAARRYHTYARLRWVKHVVLFKNHRAGAGASLAHPHWQLVALPQVPDSITRCLRRARAYRRRFGRHLYEDLLRSERADRRRMIAGRDDYTLLAAFAPRQPYETWILPHRQAASPFAGDDAAATAARALHDALTRLVNVLGEVPHNVLVFNAPVGAEDDAAFRWHIRILPRLSRLGGFEWLTKVNVATVSPEAAASALRAATSG